MIDVKEAAQKAFQYFEKFNEERNKNKGVVLMEEAELSEDEKYWFITLSYDSLSANAFQTIAGITREYKIFKIDAQTGNFISMKIRKI